MMPEREILLFLEWSAHRQGLSLGDNGETLFFEVLYNSLIYNVFFCVAEKRVLPVNVA
jgi:hypothetical protein